MTQIKIEHYVTTMDIFSLWRLGLKCRRHRAPLSQRKMCNESIMDNSSHDRLDALIDRARAVFESKYGESKDCFAAFSPAKVVSELPKEALLVGAEILCLRSVHTARLWHLNNSFSCTIFSILAKFAI